MSGVTRAFPTAMSHFARCSLFALAAACARSPSSHGASPTEAPPREPLTLTYLGVAGWQLEAGGKLVLVDPYFSRPDLDGVIVSDPAAVAARAPKRADLILIGHSHVDHLLDAPAVAQATGAQIVGGDSTARVARSLGVPAERIIPIKGGEDYAFDGFSVRVIPSLHSALSAKHELGRPVTVLPPRRLSDWEEGGTFNYLVRLGGHVIFVQSSANFIEREVEGLRPDVAIVAPGLRHEIHDYTCRLLRALGSPPLVLATHFDDWKRPPPTGDVPPSRDLAAFAAEVAACSPASRLVIPKHFVAMTAR